MTDAAVKIDGVSVVFAEGIAALKDVSVELPAGKIVGFIGPSGAGKTTLIRGIVGRQKLTKGQITVFGLPADAAQLRAERSYMTQDVSVYGDLTVSENIRYFATIFGVGRKQLATATQSVLQKVDLLPQADQLVSKLSGGQKQRVSLGIALIGSPKLMVLDEPTVGLDPVLREQLWTLFRQLAASGTSLIISSHVMDEADRCDDLLLIRDGQILAHGSPHKLCEQTGTRSVEAAFIKLVRSTT
jgi:ABC-2 type transport system ATP-binding protein